MGFKSKVYLVVWEMGFDLGGEREEVNMIDYIRRIYRKINNNVERKLYGLYELFKNFKGNF